MASPDALKDLVEALVTEQNRRRAARQVAADDTRARFLAELAQIHDRLTQAPGYVAPTPEEAEQRMAELEARFRELGYDITG
jgi:hypothetical protein